MKSIHLTLTGLYLSEILKVLHDNTIAANYVGTDQNFNVIYEISYSDEKEEIVTGIFKCISAFENFDNIIGLVVEHAFTQYHLSVQQKSEIKKPLGYSLLAGTRKALKKYQDHENGKH